jgi:hypothetical protein
MPLTTVAIIVALGAAMYKYPMACMPSPPRDSKQLPRPTIRALASSGYTPTAIMVATSLEAKNLAPLNAILQAVRTVLILTILGLINLFELLVADHGRRWADMVLGLNN